MLEGTTSVAATDIHVSWALPRRQTEESARPPADGGPPSPPVVPPSTPGQTPTHEDFFQLDVPEETHRQWLVRKLQNEINRLQQVEQLAAKGRGVAVKDVDKTSQAAEAFIGRTGHRIDRFRHEMLTADDAYLKRLNEAGFAFGDLDWYLMAKHAPERNAHILQVNPDAGPAGSGLTDEEAAEVTAAFGEDTATLEEFAQEFYEKVTRRAIKIRLDAGLISQATYDELSARWEFYVPLKGKAGVEAFPRTGKGFSVRGKEFHQALGRHSLADSPFTQALADFEESVIRAERNRVAQAFYGLAQGNPSPGFWEIPARGLPAKGKKGQNQGDAQLQLWDEITQEHVGEDGNIRPTMKGAKLPDNVVSAKFDGESRYVVVEDKALLNAMLKLGMGTSLKGLRTVSQYMRAAATMYNPEFLITNFERDLQTALVNISTEDVKGIRRGIVKDLPSAMRGVWRNTREKGDHEWSDLYDDLKAAGGKVAWFDQSTVQEKQEELQKLVEAMNNASDPRKVLYAVGQFVADANESVESAVRLSAYRQLLKAGVPKERAALAVKNLTVNFNKKGEWGHVINTLWLFSNASIQGSARIALTLSKSKTAQSIAAGMFATSFLQSYVNRLFDDDDWKDVSDYDKDNYFIFPGGGSYKLGYGWNLFHVLGNIAEESANGDLTLGDAGSRLLSAVDNAFNPLSGGSFAQFLSPSLLDPPLQWAENKNFFGGPVMPEQSRYGPKVPDNQLYFSSVRGSSKAFTDWLFKATGGLLPAEYVDAKGDTVKLPAAKGRWTLDWSPETVDHILDSVGMGAGKFLSNTVDSISELARMEVPDARNVPVARQFVRYPSQWTPRGLMHDLLDESGMVLFTPAEHDRFYDALERSFKREALTKEQAERYAKAFRSSQDKLRERLAHEGVNPTTEQAMPAFARLSGEFKALRDLRRGSQAQAIMGELRELEKEVGANQKAFEKALSPEQLKEYRKSEAMAARQTKMMWRSEDERRAASRPAGPSVAPARASTRTATRSRAEQVTR